MVGDLTASLARRAVVTLAAVDDIVATCTLDTIAALAAREVASPQESSRALQRKAGAHASTFLMRCMRAKLRPPSQPCATVRLYKDEIMSVEGPGVSQRPFLSPVEGHSALLNSLTDHPFEVIVERRAQ